MSWRIVLFFILACAVFGCQPHEEHSGHAHAAPAFDSDDVEQALNDAVKLADEGQHEKALERHQWFHENATKYSPAHLGVKLSFALADWAELGKAYPPALEALKKEGAEAAAGFRKNPNDPAVYFEAVSIHLYLDDLAEVKKLYYEGRHHKSVDSIFILSLEKLTASDDRAWLKDIIGDPKLRLKAIADQHAQIQAILKDQKDFEPGDMQSPTEGQLVALIRITAKLDGPAAGKLMLNNALKVLDTAKVRAAL